MILVRPLDSAACILAFITEIQEPVFLSNEKASVPKFDAGRFVEDISNPTLPFIS